MVSTPRIGPLLGELLHTPKVRNPRNLVKSVFYEPRSVSDGLLQEILQARNIPQAKRATLKSIRSGSGLWGVHKKMLVLDRLKDFMKPLLIVWGGEDRIIPVSHAHQAARVLSNSTVHIIPHCGHWPQLERSEEFNPLVLRFLKGALTERTRLHERLTLALSRVGATRLVVPLPGKGLSTQALLRLLVLAAVLGIVATLYFLRGFLDFSKTGYPAVAALSLFASAGLVVPVPGLAAVCAGGCS